MDLKTYLKQQGKPLGQSLGQAIGTSHLYIRQIANGHRQAGEMLALQIEKATCGAVSVEDLRPDFAELLRQAGYVRQTNHRHAA